MLDREWADEVKAGDRMVTMEEIFGAMDAEEDSPKLISSNGDYIFEWNGKLQPIGDVKVRWTFTDASSSVPLDEMDQLPWANASYVTVGVLKRYVDPDQAP